MGDFCWALGSDFEDDVRRHVTFMDAILAGFGQHEPRWLNGKVLAGEATLDIHHGKRHYGSFARAVLVPALQVDDERHWLVTSHTSEGKGVVTLFVLRILRAANTARGI